MITVNDTPKYSTSLDLRGAELQEFAKTQPGRQSYRGTLNAALELSGLGVNVRSVQGKGEAHLTQGDLGELPVVLQFAKFLNMQPVPPGLAAEPRQVGVRLGRRRVPGRQRRGDPRPDQVHRAAPSACRARASATPWGTSTCGSRSSTAATGYHLPIVSDVVRELSGQFFIVRIVGPSSSPKFEARAPAPGHEDEAAAGRAGRMRGLPGREPAPRRVRA